MKQFLRNRIAAWARRRQGPDSALRHSKPAYLHPADEARLAVRVDGRGDAHRRPFNYANSAALFLTFLLGSFALVSMHQCHRNLLRTTFVSAAAAPVFVNARGVLRVTLGNQAKLIRYGIEVSALDKASGVTDVLANGQSQAEVIFTPTKRGVLRIDRLRISTSFPYNLFRAWTWVHLPIEVVVYPKPHGALPAPADSGEKAGERAMPIAGSDEWMGLRPLPRWRFPEAGGVEAVRARRAAAREGVQRARCRAAAVRFHEAASAGDGSEAGAAVAMDRGFGRAWRALRAAHARP